MNYRRKSPKPLNLRPHRNNGAALAEAAASISLFLPIILMVIFVALECTEAYIIHNGLTLGAYQAARTISAIVSHNPTQLPSNSQLNAAYNIVNVPGVINSSYVQGSMPSTGSNPNFPSSDNPNPGMFIQNTLPTPSTVTVTAVFVPGPHVIPFPWPSISAGGIGFSVPSGLTLKSSVTYPIFPGTGNILGGGNGKSGKGGG